MSIATYRKGVVVCGRSLATDSLGDIWKIIWDLRNHSAVWRMILCSI